MDEKGNLSFLNELILDKSTSFSRGGNFEAFENDLDFINDKINDTPQVAVDNAGDDEGGPKSDGPSPVPVKEHSEIDKTATRKKVSFELPDIAEYPSDFDSDSEEEENIDHIENNGDDVVATPSCGTSLQTQTSDEVEHDCDESEIATEKPAQTKSRTSACDKCSCRLTSINVFDIPGLDTLFLRSDKKKARKKNEKKLSKKESKELRKIENENITIGSNEINHRTKATQCLKQNKTKNNKTIEKNLQQKMSYMDANNKETLHKHSHIKSNKVERKPVDHFWDPLGDSTLIKWLKNKEKEKRQKKREEKRQKREKMKATKLDDLEKACRKEISDRKVQIWMREKKHDLKLARQKSGSRVAPQLNDDCSDDRVHHAPKGFMVLKTFNGEQNGGTDGVSESCEAKAASVQAKPRKRTIKLAKTFASRKRELKTDKQVEKNSEEEKRKAKRKTYNEWIKEKRVLLKSKQTNNERMDNDKTLEQSIVVQERKRRYSVKQKSKKSVDSKWEKQGDKNSDGACGEELKGETGGSKEDKECGIRPEPQGCDHSHEATDLIASGGSNETKNDSENTSHDSSKTAYQYLWKDSNRVWVKEGEEESKTGVNIETKPPRPKTGRPKTGRPKPLVNSFMKDGKE
eukprot:gene18085-19892_t